LLRDIAEAAGINIAMISYYFGSKEKLMEALFELRTARIKMKVESLINDDSLNHFEKMYHMIDDHISRVVENTCFYKIMVTEQLINKNSALTEAVKQVKKRNIDVISEMISNGVKSGEFRKVDDLPLLMNTLMGTVVQTMLNEPFYRQYHHLENLGDKEYKEEISRRLSNYMKEIFKSKLSK